MAWWKFWAQPKQGSSPDYYEEGVELMRRELPHEALNAFRLAQRERPDDAATHEQMAVAYTRIGLPHEAIRAYRKALAVRPNSPSAHYGLAFLLLKNGQREAAAGHLKAFLSHATPDREEARHLEHARRTLARLSGESSPPGPS
ncbi:MAG: tetratricopeptide repeat protein [Gemmatimonadota bacterium]